MLPEPDEMRDAANCTSVSNQSVMGDADARREEQASGYQIVTSSYSPHVAFQHTVLCSFMKSRTGLDLDEVSLIFTVKSLKFEHIHCRAVIG